MQPTLQPRSTTHETAGADLSISAGGATGGYTGRHVFLHVVLGSLATSALVAAGVKPVLASSGAGILYVLAGFLVRLRGQQPAAVFCGTFAGMTSFAAFFNQAPSGPGFSILINVSTAILTGILYVLVMYSGQKLPNRLFNGYGGRLGAIAFAGSAVCLMTAGLLIRLSSPHFQLLVVKEGAVPSGTAHLAMILTSAAGSFFTRRFTRNINSTIPGLNVVLSASVCGFGGGVILLFLPLWGPVASLYWYAGNFAGMSSRPILGSDASILLAGAITGIFLGGLHGYASGVGGLLGFSAFLAVIFWNSVSRLTRASTLVVGTAGAASAHHSSTSKKASKAAIQSAGLLSH